MASYLVEFLSGFLASYNPEDALKIFDEAQDIIYTQLIDNILEQEEKKRNEKYECPCGSVIKQTSVKRHLTTKKHKKYIQTLIPQYCHIQ